MGLSKEAIKKLEDIHRKKLNEGLSERLRADWEQVFPEDAELRVQQAFEMLLGDEFGLTDCARLGATVDRCSLGDYNQANERSTIDL